MADAPFNTLFYGDNLDILRDRDYFPNACVDLIYLDPPFNSARSYNVLFKDESGRDSDAQITAFDDTWHWGEAAERTYYDLVAGAPERVSAAIGALRQMIGANQMMAYLVMMTARLIEMHRVLKPTGSLYLHCFPPTTRVRLADGRHVPIVSVSPGDNVTSDAGVMGTVANCLHRQYSGDLCSISISGVPYPLECTPEHKIYILPEQTARHLRFSRNRTDRTRRGVSGWQTRRVRMTESDYAAQARRAPAAELTAGDYCLVPIDCEVWTGDDLFLDIPSSKHPNAKPVPSRVLFTPELAELCGYYLAEGNVKGAYVNWTLHSKEHTVADRIAELVQIVFGLDCYIFPIRGKNAIRVVVSSVSLANFFVEHFGTGSGNKHLPLVVQKAPPQIQKSMFAAWANGDGHISVRSTRTAVLRVTTTSLNLAMQMQQVALRLDAVATVGIGNRPHYRPVDHARVAYRVQVNSNDFGKVGLEPVYTRSQDEPAPLRRAFILEQWLCLPIRSIQRRSYEGEVFNLHIEPEHAYCAGGVKVSNCDPTASHYLKIVLDTIFGPESFRNEIVWKRTSTHSDAGRFGAIHDVIFFYSKSDKQWTWNKQHMERDDSALKTHDLARDPDGRLYRLGDVSAAGPGPARIFAGRLIEPPVGNHWRFSQENIDQFVAEGRIVFTKNGTPRYKRYLDEIPGIAVQDVWTDINPVNSGAKEILGYPTQKPLALLERIISASSNPGDVVLDPFCGCGTAIAAAQKLDRRWIGIDITHLSIALMKYRLSDMFGLKEKADYRVIGEPADLAGARALAAKDGGDRYQFQWWALSLVRAKPLGGDGGKQGKKGSDKGIDGVISFTEGGTGRLQRVLVQVKSGGVKSGDIRDLRGTLDRDGAAIGLFITLEKPSRDMLTEATTAGFYKSPGWHTDYPRVQILTIEDLLAGKAPLIPGSQQTFRQAARHTANDGPEQMGLEME